MTVVAGGIFRREYILFRGASAYVPMACCYSGDPLPIIVRGYDQGHASGVKEKLRDHVLGLAIRPIQLLDRPRRSLQQMAILGLLAYRRWCCCAAALTMAGHNEQTCGDEIVLLDKRVDRPRMDTFHIHVRSINGSIDGIVLSCDLFVVSLASRLVTPVLRCVLARRDVCPSGSCNEQSRSAVRGPRHRRVDHQRNAVPLRILIGCDISARILEMNERVFCMSAVIS